VAALGLPAERVQRLSVEDVLVDAATRHAALRILYQLRGWKVAAHALTHVHPDH
jgi:hydroxyacylglutathione hydrolase